MKLGGGHAAGRRPSPGPSGRSRRCRRCCRTGSCPPAARRSARGSTIGQDIRPRTPAIEQRGPLGTGYRRVPERCAAKRDWHGRRSDALQYLPCKGSSSATCCFVGKQRRRRGSRRRQRQRHRIWPGESWLGPTPTSKRVWSCFLTWMACPIWCSEDLEGRPISRPWPLGVIYLRLAYRQHAAAVSRFLLESARDYSLSSIKAVGRLQASGNW